MTRIRVDSPDDLAWPAVLSALRAGGHLRIDNRWTRATVDGIDVDDPRHGRALTMTRVRLLERRGILHQTESYRYELTEKPTGSQR